MNGCAVVAQAGEVEVKELKQQVEEQQTAAMAAQASIKLLQQQLADKDGSVVSLREALATDNQVHNSEVLLHTS